MRRDYIVHSTYAIVINLMSIVAIAYSLSLMIQKIIIKETDDSIATDDIIFFDYHYYLYSIIGLTIILAGLLFFDLQRPLILIEKNIATTLSISISLMVIGMLYPAIPSVSSYQHKAEKLLATNTRQVVDDIHTAILAGDYNYLNETYIKSQYNIGYTHFKLIPDEKLKDNISLLSRGDYSPIYPIANYVFGNANNSATLHIDNKANNNISASDSSSPIYWDYDDTDLINKANRVSFSAEITGTPDKCYVYYYRTNKKGTWSDPIDKGRFCAKNRNPYRIALSSSARGKGEGIDMLRFWIQPEILAENDASPWKIENTKILLDKSGLEKNAFSYCIEGFHDGSKDNPIHTDGQTLFAGPCQ